MAGSAMAFRQALRSLAGAAHTGGSPVRLCTAQHTRRVQPGLLRLAQGG